MKKVPFPRPYYANIIAHRGSSPENIAPIVG